MKKILVFMMLVSVVAFAQTATSPSWVDENVTCYTSAGSGHPKTCYQYGYVCELTADANPLQDAFAFSLGWDASCNQLFMSTVFPTVGREKYIDANGNEVEFTANSTKTRFFLIKDDYRAGALSMTTVGSFLLSAFNNSTKISVIYQQGNDDTEYGGVRVKNITLMK